MSSRIHEIAKQYNIEPKEMLSWLKEQGFVAADTKSVSSTVSKIYYDEIAKKYAKPVEVPVAPAAVRFDMPVMLATAVACLPIFFTGSRIARWEGALFIGLYAAYLAYLVLAAQQHEGFEAEGASGFQVDLGLKRQVESIPGLQAAA